MPDIHRALDSANARDCLLHLSRTKLSERDDLVQLNDKLIDIIEHVHYMEAEHSALEHDYNLLKSGIQSDSSGINEIFELEIRNVRVGVEDANRSRQQFLNEQSNLTQQVSQLEQQWRHIAKAALGVPKEVDDDFKRISQIEAENSLTLKRIKYVEDKNRLIKQNNGRIYEQINLMRMRKDQAVSLHQEYVLRKNELLHSIRNLEEDNKRVIMNEHKYFIRDRTVDRHSFRDQLRQAIADIRADYESKRLRNEEEIRVRTESAIRRIQESTTGSVTRDKLKEELLIVKRNCSGLQQQVSDTEIRNVTLTQQIELLRLDLSENHHSFEISLDAKTRDIEKLREQCTSIGLELERLCDLNIDLQKEIAKYRELLDQSGNLHVRSTNGNIRLEGTLNRITETRHTSVVTPIREVPSYPIVETPVHRYPIHEPQPIYPSSPIPMPTVPLPAPLAPLPVSPLPPPPVQTYERTVFETRTGSQLTSRDHSPFPTSIPTYVPAPYRPYEEVPRDDTSVTYRPRSDHQSHDSTSTIITGVDLHYSPPVQHSPRLETVRETVISTPLPGYERSHHLETEIQSTLPSDRFRSGLIGYDGTGSVHDRQYIQSSSLVRDGTRRSDRRQTTIFNPDATITTTTIQSNGNFEYSSDVDSVDEENFQRFTRWYKGRVKIMDVTPEYIQLVNRSSKKSVDIGGFKVIHEYGHKSVYVDLPTGLILGPKESLKIFARSAVHEFGSVVAEIDLFDTTTQTNTSIRNTNNEVKSWFVYTSNTEIGDHHH